MNPLIEELGTLARRWHYSCDDCWYSCSQDPECCDDERRGKPCDCGADAHNAKVEALLTKLRETEGHHQDCVSVSEKDAFFQTKNRVASEGERL